MMVNNGRKKRGQRSISNPPPLDDITNLTPVSRQSKRKRQI